MVEIGVNGKKYKADSGSPLLPILLKEGIDIPYLCFHHSLSPYGACRLCLVEVVAGGKKGITTACTLPVTSGLEIKTDTSEIIQIRRILLEMYLAEAPGSKKIRELAEKYGVETSRFNNFDLQAKGDRCILCGRCVRVCNEILGVGAINFSGRGTRTSVNTPWYDVSSVCIGCGACAYVCPADAIDIVIEGDTKIMETWHNTRLKLQACLRSSEFFATEKELNFVKRALPDLPDQLKQQSPPSRRIEFAKEFLLKPKTSSSSRS